MLCYISPVVVLCSFCEAAGVGGMREIVPKQASERPPSQGRGAGGAGGA